MGLQRQTLYREFENWGRNLLLGYAPPLPEKTAVVFSEEVEYALIPEDMKFYLLEHPTRENCQNWKL